MSKTNTMFSLYSIRCGGWQAENTTPAQNYTADFLHNGKNLIIAGF